MSDSKYVASAKYAELDAELEAEFAEELDAENEEVNAEAEELGEGNEPEASPDEDETEGEPEAQKEEPENQDTPANRAFAEQRHRIKELEADQADKDEMIAILMDGTGLTTQAEFHEALKQAKEAKEMDALGLDDNAYDALQKEREEKASYQKQLKEKDEQISQRNLYDFNTTIDKYVSDFGISRDEIFGALSNDGVTMEAIKSSTNHDRLIKVAMVDRIAEVKAQRLIEKENNRGRVDKKRHSGAAEVDLSFEDQQDALLEADLAKYLKSKER